MVAVGAPYYGANNQGAVFVYRTNNDQLELSQTILPSDNLMKGFGMKLSDVLENDIGVTTGFGVAAPEADTVTYIKARPVVRFQDDTRIKVNPASIDPRKSPEITLTVEPRVVKQSNYNNDILVKVTVSTDIGRLQPKQAETETTTLSGRSNTGNTLQFKYSLKDSLVGDSNLNLNDPNYSPIRFDIFWGVIVLIIVVIAFLCQLSTVSQPARAVTRIHVQPLIQRIVNMERIPMKVDRKFIRKLSQQESSSMFVTYLKVVNAMSKQN